MITANYTHPSATNAPPLTCGQCRKWRKCGDPSSKRGCCTAKTELVWGSYPQWLYPIRDAFDHACPEFTCEVPF